MALLLGVDTGGTYTDAVLIRDEKHVVASAKALTTREDLAIGVGAAVSSVLAKAGVQAGDVSMASLSTTLATNALVENQGGRVGLIFVGFRERDLDAHGVREALRGDPFLICSGGHDHAGTEAAPLDRAAVQAFLNEHGQDVSAYAVAAHFATRNAAHETEVSTMIAAQTGCPVSASHQLSARLNGPKRATTSVLNARLIGMIDALIGRAQQVLIDLGIRAPLMVVRGDGALISAEQARERPIETILSGPAASIVGARWLTAIDHALVSDIGGTTTDVAVLRNGRPAIDPAGARVGPFRTMVEAVAMRTSGLGGDSEVHVKVDGLQGGLTLGPRRVLPIALIARDAERVVHDALDQQLRNSVPGEHDARFVRAVPSQNREGLAARDAAVLALIGEGMKPLGDVVRARIDHGALQRLVGRGLVQVAGVTPTDASHVLGQVDVWDASAAGKALALLARRRIGSGNRLAPTAEAVAAMIVHQLTHQTSLALLETAFAEDPAFSEGDCEELARHMLMQRGLAGHSGLVRLDTGLNVPVVGLGASAATYYPAVGQIVGSQMILPEHADVANAIGAVVGRITMRETATITSPSEGLFRVHLASGPQEFADQDVALQALETYLRKRAAERAQAAGAADIQISIERDIRAAKIDAREVFIEATLTVEATGRPGVAAA